MKIGSLCSGYGGLDLAAEYVFGANTVWQAENDKDASKVLATHLDVPNYGDLTTIDWANVEPIDLATAGWPCQPWSLAGKKRGAADERAIWPEIARAIRELRPRYVFLENVSAVVVLGELARAAGDLAEIGYDAQWTCLRADEIGACHRRERFFILATDTEGPRRRVRDTEDIGPAYREVNPFRNDRDASPITLLPTPRTTDANGAGSHGCGGDDLRTTVALLPTPRASRGASTTETSYALGGNRSDEDRMQGEVLLGPKVDWGKYEPAIRRWESITRPAPTPTEPNKNGNPRLSAKFAEWMMGLPAGWVTDVTIPRNAQLRILGNGVVPQQAVAALSLLLRMEEAS